jgi:eukaryotic-like serine/threonine-protein kinase
LLELFPPRNYSAIEQFSDDIRRHLDGETVGARADTFAYRGSKFIQRHKTLVAATLLIFVSLVIALTVTLREAHIAKQQKAQAGRRLHDLRDLAHSNLVDLHSAIAHLPGSAEARHIAIQQSVKYLDELNSESGRDIELTREVSDAYEKIGDIQGAYSGAGIGDSSAPLSSYQKAFSLRNQIVASPGSNLDDKKSLLLLQRKYVRCLMLTGNTAQAYQVAHAALVAATALANDHPTDPGAIAAKAQAHFWLAAVMAGDGTSSCTRQISEAIEHDQVAASLFGQLAQSGNQDASVRHRADLLLAFHLSKARRFEESRAILDRAIAAEIVESGPRSASLVNLYNFRGIAFERQGEHRLALAEYEKSLPLARSLVAADPQDLNAQLGLQIAKAHISMQQARLGSKRSGLAGLNDAISRVEHLYEADPSQIFYQSLLTVGYSYQGEVLSSLGDHLSAASRYQKALATADSIAYKDLTDLESRLSISKLRASLGVVLSRSSSYSEARKQFSASLSSFEELTKLRPQDAESLYFAEKVRKYSVALDECQDGLACPKVRDFELPTLVN